VSPSKKTKSIRLAASSNLQRREKAKRRKIRIKRKRRLKSNQSP
jgi:hypothetical protein